MESGLQQDAIPHDADVFARWVYDWVYPATVGRTLFLPSHPEQEGLVVGGPRGVEASDWLAADIAVHHKA